MGLCGCCDLVAEKRTMQQFAVQNANRQIMLQTAEDKEGQPFDVYATTEAELGKHSIGVGVYFASCKFVGFYVLFMGVFSLYTLFKSGLSNYHDMNEVNATKGPVPYTYTWIGSSSIGHTDPESDARAAMGILHFVLLVITFGAIAALGAAQHRLGRVFNQEVETAADYCVEFKGLPKSATEAQIKEFFKQDEFKNEDGELPEIEKVIVATRINQFL